MKMGLMKKKKKMEWLRQPRKKSQNSSNLLLLTNDCVVVVVVVVLNRLQQIRLMEDNIEDIGQISQLIINEIDIPKKTCLIGKILIREWSK